MANTLIADVKAKIAQIQGLRSDYDKKQGEKDQITKQLKHEFDVDKAEDGEKLLEDYATQAANHETELKTVREKLDGILAETKTEETAS